MVPSSRSMLRRPSPSTPTTLRRTRSSPPAMRSAPGRQWRPGRTSARQRPRSSSATNTISTHRSFAAARANTRAGITRESLRMRQSPARRRWGRSAKRRSRHAPPGPVDDEQARGVAALGRRLGDRRGGQRIVEGARVHGPSVHAVGHGRSQGRRPPKFRLDVLSELGNLNLRHDRVFVRGCPGAHNPDGHRARRVPRRGSRRDVRGRSGLWSLPRLPRSADPRDPLARAGLDGEAPAGKPWPYPRRTLAAQGGSVGRSRRPPCVSRSAPGPPGCDERGAWGARSRPPMSRRRRRVRGHERVIALLNDVLTAGAHRHQPVLHPRQDVRELGLSSAGHAAPRGVLRGNEARRSPHRAHPLPGRGAQHAAAGQGQRGRDCPRAASPRPRARARRPRRRSTRASRPADRWATTAAVISWRTFSAPRRIT